MKTVYDLLEILLYIVFIIGAVGCIVLTIYCILSLEGRGYNEKD